MKAVETAPGDWSVRFSIARSYVARGCYHQALEHLRGAVRLDPNRHNCWYWIGRCCEELGEVEEAKQAYGRALAANPAFLKARYTIHELERRGKLHGLATWLKRKLKRRGRG